MKNINKNKETENIDSLSIFEIALYETQIPLNLGAIMRTTACLNVRLHIIEPLGFIFTNRKNLGRAALDYNPNYILHSSFNNFLITTKSQRKIIFTPHTGLFMSDFIFYENDILVFGREENGMEPENMALCDGLVSIPMNPKARSLNLAASVAIGGSWVSNQLKKQYK
jgi:tRNA (cytidine/uridine-2'-O-)-methyltransferase